MKNTKREFKIPCEWAMYGVLRIEAKDIEEALKLTELEAETCSLPEGEYIDGSFELNLDKDLIKIMN